MAKKYKVAIIDDESKIREVLRHKLSFLDQDIQIVGEASSAQEAFDLIQKTKPDIIFLDISMPGETGLQLIGRFENIDFEIIFATGYDEYALEALRISAVDYILKPFRTEDVKNALDKAKLRIANRLRLHQYEVLKENLSTQDQADKTISIVNGNSYEVIKIVDIVRCEGWQKYTKIFTSSGQQYVSSYNLGHFVDVLAGFHFYPTHKSHMINTNMIQSYNKELSLVTMKDNAEVPVSRRRRTDFVQNVLASAK